MTIDDKIRDEKIQYDISRKVSKISAVLSNKSNQYEYLTGEKKLHSHLKQQIQQAKFTYSSLVKASKKQKRTNEN